MSEPALEIPEDDLPLYFRLKQKAFTPHEERV